MSITENVVHIFMEQVLQNPKEEDIFWTGHFYYAKYE